MSFPAYLVLWKNGLWDEVFRLAPGKKIPIGRASGNFIVLNDERCSRVHAVLSFSEKDDAWVIEDQGSRNGTYLNDKRLSSDKTCRLNVRDVIRIGSTELLFLRELKDNDEEEDATPITQEELLDSHQVPLGEESTEETLITCRRDRAKLLDSLGMTQSAMVSDRHTRTFVASLCQLAIEISREEDQKSRLEIALNHLLRQLPLNYVAILLLPSGGVPIDQKPDEHLLDITAFNRKNTTKPYQQISDFLAQTVLESRNAVIAKNVRNDSILGRRNSDGIIDTTSVICAPIYDCERVWGLIHAYAVDLSLVPNEHDLDFTLGVAEILATALKNVQTQTTLKESLKQVRSENDVLRHRLGVQSELIGDSPAILEITEQVALAAGTRATVLIRGESGVGKELVARAVHYSSPRAKGPFICLNCAALSEDLLTSELFGHEKGAFTGATERKIGKFEAAHGGSLMLDEIGEMSLGIQAKFLRVLEGHSFERVGGNQPIRADVRVIAATNRDLEQEVLAGRFRKDLFFRLRVIEMLVPPLRERRMDIGILAEHFFQQYREETGKRLHGFTLEAIDKLQRYDWPGNVRELKNVIERAVVFARGDRIEPEDLLLSHLFHEGNVSTPTALSLWSENTLPESLESIELKYIQAILEYTEGNKSRAAMLLGIERTTLDRKLKKIAQNQ